MNLSNVKKYKSIDIQGFSRNALLAQPDRVFGYEPKGQGFESLAARHNKKEYRKVLLFVMCVLICRDSKPERARSVKLNSLNGC